MLAAKGTEYTSTVEWSDEDHVFIARVVELPGLATHGDTEEEALKNLGEVIELYFQED